jgi:hypothetical protein
MKMRTNLEIYHNKDDEMWYVYDKTNDNHEYIFDYFSDVSRWVKEFYLVELDDAEDRKVTNIGELNYEQKTIRS